MGGWPTSLISKVKILNCRKKFDRGRECPNPLEMPSRGRQTCLEIDNRLEQQTISLL